MAQKSIKGLAIFALVILYVKGMLYAEQNAQTLVASFALLTHSLPVKAEARSYVIGQYYSDF